MHDKCTLRYEPLKMSQFAVPLWHFSYRYEIKFVSVILLLNQKPVLPVNFRRISLIEQNIWRCKVGMLYSENVITINICTW